MRKLHNIAIAPSIAAFLTIMLLLFSLSGIQPLPWWVVLSPVLALAAFYIALVLIGIGLIVAAYFGIALLRAFGK